jgi:hypothetical protein
LVRLPIMVSVAWALPPSSAVAAASPLPISCPWASYEGPWVYWPYCGPHRVTAVCATVRALLTADEAGLMEAPSVALDLLCVVRSLLTGRALGSSTPVWHPGNGRDGFREPHTMVRVGRRRVALTKECPEGQKNVLSDILLSNVKNWSRFNRFHLATNRFL